LGAGGARIQWFSRAWGPRPANTGSEIKTARRVLSMGKKDARVDAYIARSAPFARPILKRIRGLVHAGCPKVEETIKWGMPSFEYKGILCGMAAFKAHCVFGFWKDKLVMGGAAKDDAMGQFGCLTKVSQLPSRARMIALVKKAAGLNEAGIKAPRVVRSKAPKKLVAPAYFMKAVKKNKKALGTFEGFSPSSKREYVEWVTEAKTEETRERRLATAVEWMSQGKRRNWKYERC
jgi:hypothetical protein